MPYGIHNSRWHDTTTDEMRQFIGLVLLMGIIHKPVIEMYWSTDPLYVTPLFSSVMQRNRFSMLLKFFAAAAVISWPGLLAAGRGVWI